MDHDNLLSLGKCVFDQVDEFETDDLHQIIKVCLLEGINKYMKKKNLPLMTPKQILELNIMSIDQDGFSRAAEIKYYSYYSIENKKGIVKMYVKGELVTI